MDKKIQFQEKLAGILAQAEHQNKRISTGEVEQYFSEEHLNQEQMLLVYDYLLSQKVIVSGYVKQETEVPAEEDKPAASFSADEEAYLNEYLRELSGLKISGEEERVQLLNQAAQNDAAAKSRLVEAYLPIVVEIAKRMHTKDAFIGDLVQEGNVSLMLAIDTLELTGGDEHIRREIKAGIQAFLEEQKELKIQDSKMVEQVNRLDEGIRSLGEELGRKVSVDELALFLDMEEDEILDILKLAGEELEEEPAEEE